MRISDWSSDVCSSDLRVGRRLFLPESWTSDPDRMARARIPVERRVALSKPEIAIEEIDRVIASGVHFGCVLADAGYGSSAPFRHALSERGLLWAVGLSRRQMVYQTDEIGSTRLKSSH